MLGALRRWNLVLDTGRSPQYWRAQRSAEGTADNVARPSGVIDVAGRPSSSASIRSLVSSPTARAR